jgi:peptide/nickel transport system substrate-binding protein
MRNQLGNFMSFTDSIDKVVAVDPLTVRFICSEPKANMLGMVVWIVPEHIWSKVDPKAAGRSYANRPPIIGTGPFRTVEWKRGEYVRMVANKEYWGGAPKIDEVVFVLYKNADTMAADLKSGKIQVAWDVPQAQFAPLSASPDLAAINGVVNGFTHLGFNCYTGKGSLGNPVLRDWRFRQALNWAIDKQRIVDLAYMGHAQPATTIIRSGYYKPPVDYHWQPPANEAYAYDPAKAKAALDVAGYRDIDGDGVRDYHGKPIRLRLFARTQSATDQLVGKLITGWLEKIGLRVDYQVLDEGALSDMIYNFKGSTWAPDYDLFLWYWYSDPDPNFILSVLTTGQITQWSDTGWSDPAYDRLYREQQTTMDLAKRVRLIHQMQAIVYRESPYIPLTYTDWLEAYNNRDWSGWVRTPAGDGPVIYTQYNADTYLQVHPTTATSAGGSSSGVSPLVVVLVIAAALAVPVGVLVIRARRGRRVEE